MRPLSEIRFDSFRFIPQNGHLRRGTVTAYLPPKDSAVLLTLVENAGNLIAKPDIMQKVWPDVAVGDDVLKACIKRIRKILGDDFKSPRFIETVHRRGYRFICPVINEGRSTRCPVNPMGIPPFLVGRENELRRLEERLNLACSGIRQIVFIAGEAGIGKTALLHAFSQKARKRCSMIAVHGQCIEHYGPNEGYRPIIEALDGLCNSEQGVQATDFMKRFAPMWLIQMPWLISENERDTVQKMVAGAPPERMLRELAVMLETLSMDIPLMIVLEDLQWSDYPTLDAINLIAHRNKCAHLMIVGTYRPEDFSDHHPLQSMIPELQVHDHCQQIVLPLLSYDDVNRLVRRQIPDLDSHHHLAHWLGDHTEGNPLYVKSLLDHAQQRGWLKTGPDTIWQKPSTNDIVQIIPASLHQMIGKQIDRLSDSEKKVVEIASTFGKIFPIKGLASRVENQTLAETICHRLAQRGLLIKAIDRQTGFDVTQTACYQFIHTFYRQIVYSAIPPIRRQQLHLEIGRRLEGDRVHRACDQA